MRKSERLLKILTFLQSKRRAVTAATLADYFGVSERTIYRDIEALAASGIEINGEAGIGYVLRNGELLPPLTFTEAELESLVLGVRMVQCWGDAELGQAADGALEKIRAILPDRLHYLYSLTEETLLVPNFEREKVSRFSGAIREAVKTKRKIQIAYVKENEESSERVVWPLGLVFWGKVWTLIGWCELRNSYRVFRIDRVRDISNLDEQFETTEARSLRHYLSTEVDCGAAYEL